MKMCRSLVVVLLVIGVAGAAGACRSSPVAPSSGPSLDDLAVRRTGSAGSDVGNRVLFPQSQQMQPR